MKILLFLGSSRESTPPSPARVGHRLAIFLQNYLQKKSIEVELIDPLDYTLPSVFKPLFSFKKTEAPKDLSQLQDKILEADGHIMLSPEYNHSMSPTLVHLLNHFPSSAFSYKPSLICTYSQGQWGGARAAVQMRPFLSELGCLPVSAMLHFPHAHQLLTKDGVLNSSEDLEKWEGYLQHGIGQLCWWMEACKAQRKIQDPFELSKPFLKNPSERNAPKQE